jgi:hypothetical protein
MPAKAPQSEKSPGRTLATEPASEAADRSSIGRLGGLAMRLSQDGAITCQAGGPWAYIRRYARRPGHP